MIRLAGICLLTLALLAPRGFAEDLSIRVGIPLPLKGPKARFGELLRKSYAMALEEINASGGIGKGIYAGHKLEFLFVDTFGRAETAKKVTERLITREEVPMIMGGYGGSAVYAMAKVCEQTKTPFVSPSAAADEITRGRRRYVFRINPPASTYTSGLQGFLSNVVRPSSMAILFEETRFGRSSAEAMKKWCEENYVGLVLFESYEPWAGDFKATLATLGQLQPDAVLVVARLVDALLLVRQSAELDIRHKLLLGGVGPFTSAPFLQRSGVLAEKMVSAAIWIPRVNYPGAMEYVSNYQRRYGTPPDYHGAQAYAAAYVCQDVLARTRSLRAKDLLKALRATEMMTPFGPVKFVSDRAFRNQNRLPTLVVQVQDGTPVTIWPPEAATAGFVHPQ